MTGSDHSDKEFRETRNLYVSMMSLYELADKLFGATYVAFMRAQDLSIAQISNLFSIQQILQAVFDYPTGTISDKIGRKKIMGYGFIVWGTGILLYAFAVNFWTFLPAMVFMALGLALISGAPSAWLVDQMIAKGDIYESKNYHNVVFVGRDKEQNPRYAAMRGTDEKRYRGEAKGSEKAYGFGYIGTDEKLFVFESPIDLLSYITAVPEDWEKHSYISLGGLSEKAMKRMYTEYPHIHSIYLCLDNDEPGNERCRQFVSLIPEELSVYRLEPVKKDWNECLAAEVPVENMAKQMCWRDAREKPVPVMKMSEVEETVVQWLWYPFIPFGKVTLIQGNPGKGKTWLAMAIAAYCTNGKELPNALPIEPFNVLYQTAEDGIADTIKPRLAKCGADMTRVRFINEEEKQLSMTDDRIEKAIRQNNVRLMIMDPIQAYLGANVDMNRANEIRPLFRHLSTIAERTGCAIVLIGHLNKSSGSQSDYRSLGSIDIAAAVRSILFVEKVEKEKEQDIRVVYQQKDSLAKKENPVAFSLGEEGLKWLGEYDISIEDLLSGESRNEKGNETGKGTEVDPRIIEQTENNVFRRIRGRTASLWDFFQNRKRCKKAIGK